MLATARHQRILSLLRDQGTVSASELQRNLDVTAMTVWRDLKALDELGLLRRTRGGARSLEHTFGEPDFEVKKLRSLAAKAQIASLAAREFVREGDTIALEGGTTVAALIEHLPKKRISVVTNSLPVALRVRSLRPEIPVEVAGGWLSAISGNTIGPGALRAMDKWQASVCFLGATGFDAEVGPSDPNPFEIEAKRMLASRARRVVMLLDSSPSTRRAGFRSTSSSIDPRHAPIASGPLPSRGR